MPWLSPLFALCTIVGQPARIIAEPPPDRVAIQDQQLKTCREGLVDPEARPSDRRRWAELLLSYRTPQAVALTVELLGDAQRVEVQRALCRVIADRAAAEPLAPALAQPLLELLGSGAEDLRGMAARALADFSGADVATQLGALAAKADAPLEKRLAAIDALAPNVHRREIVAQLISLLDGGVPQVTERVVNALQAAAPERFNGDMEAWRAWWAEESRLDQEAWLAKQLQLYRGRSRSVSTAFGQFREENRRRQSALTKRIGSFQREVFRAISEGQRDAKLVEWLADPLPVVRLGAVTVIKSRMADEGRRPTGRVLTALLGLLKNDESSVRREVLEIVQNLNDPLAVQAVLAQAETEKDPTTRHAVFRALGRLDQPQAIPALIREIDRAESHLDCVREAAIALGRLAERPGDDATLQPAIEPLKRRYAALPAGDTSMGAALLTAMAGVASLTFAGEFLEVIESDEPALLRPAIRGLVRIKDVSKLRRLRTLMVHGDPLVRRAANEAVGRLGREDADVESLLTRLNPATEANEAARQAAWNGFRHLLSQRSIRERIDAAERLHDVPAYHVMYLEQLADAIPPGNGNTTLRDRVLDRLAALLQEQQRFADAVVRLRQLRELDRIRLPAATLAIDLRLLRASLDAQSGRVAALIRTLADAAPDADAKRQIVETVAGYVEQQDPPRTVEELRTVLPELRAISPDLFGKSWAEMVKRVAARVGGADETSSPTSRSPNP